MKMHMLGERVLGLTGMSDLTRCGLVRPKNSTHDVTQVDCKNCLASYYAEKTEPQSLEEIYNSIPQTAEYRLMKQNVGKELGDMLDSVNAQIEEVKKIAEHQNLAPESMVYSDGTFIMLKCNMAKIEIIRAMIDLDDIRA